MMKGIHRGTVAAYMRNWLAQHGSLPTGTHKVKVHEKRTGPMRWSAGADARRRLRPAAVRSDLPGGRRAPNGTASTASRPASGSPTTAASKAITQRQKSARRHGVEGVVVSTSHGRHACIRRLRRTARWVGHLIWPELRRSCQRSLLAGGGGVAMRGHPNIQLTLRSGLTTGSPMRRKVKDWQFRRGGRRVGGWGLPPDAICHSCG